MALKEKSVYIPFVRGREDKIDGVQLQAPSFLEMVNCRQRKSGQIVKRPGRQGLSPDSYSNEVSSSTSVAEGLGGLRTLTTIKAIHQRNGAPFLADGLYISAGSKDSNGNRVVKPWTSAHVTATNRADLFLDSGTLAGVDICESGSRNWRAVGTLVGTSLRLRLEHLDGSITRVTDYTATGVSEFRLIRNDQDFVCLYRDSATNTLYGTKCDTSNLSAGWIARVSLQTDFNSPGMDVCTIGDPAGQRTLAIVYNNTTSMKVFEVTAALGVVGSPAKTNLAHRADGLCNIDVSYDNANGMIVVAYNNNADTFPYIVGYNPSTLAVSATLTQVDGAQTAGRIVAGRNPALGTISVCYDVYSGGGAPFLKIRSREWTFGGASVSFGNTFFGYQLASKMAYDSEGVRWWVKRAVNEGLTANTGYYLISPYARDLPRVLGVAGKDTFMNGLTASQRITQLQTDSGSNGTRYAASFFADNYFVSAITAVGSQDQYAILTSFSTSIEAPTDCGVEYQGNAHLAGGYPSFCDGRGVYGSGYIHRPQIRSGTLGSGGSLTVSSNYSYLVTYRWYDAAGNRHESAPSAPLTKTLGGADTKVTLDVTNLQMDPRCEVDSGSVQIVIWRTLANGSTYYREQFVANNASAFNNAAIVSSASDASISGNEQIYTGGSRVANDPPPASSAVCIWNRRLWYASGNKLYPSTLQEQGVAPGWSERLAVSVSDAAFVTYALCPLQNSLLIFGNNGVYYLQGDGPTNTIGGGWQNPEKLPGALGCIEPRSVLETPMGVFYQAIDGRLRSVGLDLSIKLTGDSIENTSIPLSTTPFASRRGYVISSAHDPLFREIHFLMRYQGDTSWLTYSYEYNTWSTNTGDVVPRSIAYVRGPERLFFGNEGSSSYPWAFIGIDLGDPSPAVWTEYGNPYTMSFRTGWVASMGVGGWQRVRRWSFDGVLNDTTGSIQVEYYKDYEPTATAAKVFALNTLGLSAGDPLDLRVDPAFQTCKAFSLRVAETQSSPSGTQNFISFSGLTAIVAGESIQSHRAPEARQK